MPLPINLVPETVQTSVGPRVISLDREIGNMLLFSGETPFTGLSVLRSCGAQRSMIRDLSR